MKYRRRPVEVEAVQYIASNLKEMESLCGYDFVLVPLEYRDDDPGETAEVFNKTNSRWIGVKEGQWIIKENDSLYPLDSNIFEATYEPVASQHMDINIHQN